MSWLAAACQETVIVGQLPPPFPDTHHRPDATAADSGSNNAAGPAGAGADQSTIDASISIGPPRATAQVDLSSYTVSIEARSRDAFCRGRGSPLTSARADDAVGDCETRVERRVFAFGMCACNELRVGGDTFLIDSFDSSAGPYSAGQTGGNIAVSSSNLQLANMTDVRGSVWVAGEGTLTLTDNLLVAFDLKTNGPLLISGGAQHVERDLWVASDVIVDRGKLLIDGDAYQAAAKSGLTAASIAGQRYVSDYRVPMPCKCGADAPVDVAALVAEARDLNDNAAASFSSDALDIASLSSDYAVVPCGRLFTSTLTLGGPSTYFIWPEGRSALFVAGDLTVSELSTLFLNAPNSAAPFINAPAPGELDLFIAGDIVIGPNASLMLGDSTRPASTRLFLAGEIKAQGAIALAAQLYAPNATFSTQAVAADSDVYGAVFARAIQLNSKRFHFDRAILHAGEACAAPAPQRCAGCNECPDDLACVAGSCGGCASDADCCEPAACSAGKCQLLLSDGP